MTFRILYEAAPAPAHLPLTPPPFYRQAFAQPGPSAQMLCSPGSVVLKWGQSCPPGDIWQCLETFWVITGMGGLLLVRSG